MRSHKVVVSFLTSVNTPHLPLQEFGNLYWSPRILMCVSMESVKGCRSSGCRQRTVESVGGSTDSRLFKVCWSSWVSTIGRRRSINRLVSPAGTFGSPCIGTDISVKNRIKMGMDENSTMFYHQ